MSPPQGSFPESDHVDPVSVMLPWSPMSLLLVEVQLLQLFVLGVPLALLPVQT